LAKPAVFISHSTVRRTEDPYLSAVAEALKRERYQVLLDKEGLRPSDDWGMKIVNWLASCHAAVVILSNKAVGSDYVKFEVGNLFARWQRERIAQTEEFVFCVVVPKDVDAETVRTGYYGTIGLPQQHLILAASPEEAVEQVLQRLEPLRARIELPPTPLDKLVLRIEVLLGAIDSRLLRLGLDALHLDPDPAVDLARQLAEALLFSPLALSVAALQAMQPMPNPQSAWRIYQLLAPSWVGPEAALALRGRLDAAAGGAVHVTLNADHPEFTPAMYLQRATGNLLEASGMVLDFTTLSGRRGVTAQALAHDVHALLVAKLVGVDADPDDAEDTVRLHATLRFQQTANRAIVVALKLGADRLLTMRRAIEADKYPGVAFLALCAAATKGDEPEFLLLPELQVGQEEVAYSNCVQAESIVKGLMND